MMFCAPGQSPLSMIACWAALASFSVSRQITRQYVHTSMLRSYLSLASFLMPVT